MVKPSRSVATRLVPQPVTDGAGVRIRRAIGTPALADLDPFLLLDEFRSDRSDDYAAGFPDHPHRGFETVTYMLAGRMQHRDHLGNAGELGPGSVQWMTAGSGIVHSEMPLQENGLMWGFQLWVNLPAADKMQPPRYQEFAAPAIPTLAAGEGCVLRLVAGRHAGAEGPVSGISTEPFYGDLEMAARGRFTWSPPAGSRALLYLFEGEVVVAGESCNAPVLVPLDGEGDVSLAAGDSGARMLLLAGRPLGEPVARYGPFVMTTGEQLEQAFADYRAGRLGRS